jgi:hypothetical protein
MNRAWVYALSMSLCTLAAGCGSSLGDCNKPAAEELVYSSSGLVATKGQALVHDSCGNGAFCHSSAAIGDARYGAPAGMNFDMLPVPTGWPKLVDRRDDAWSLIESGHMPPGEAGAKVLGDGGWTFAVTPTANSEKLQPISTDQGKAAVRNWLACGAPLVSETKQPQWVQPSVTPSNDFDAIYKTILSRRCAIGGCHNESAAGQLSMTDACAAYQALLIAGPCSMKRVRPGDTDSLLLDKLQSTTPSCGGPMPPTGQLDAASVDAVRAWIVAGAPGPKCN